jgi:hypothetical protein
VGVRRCLAYLGEDPHKAGQLLGRLLAGGQQRCQGLALDQLHGEERALVGEGAQLIHGGNAGVLQLPGDPRFLDEPLRELGPVAVAFEEHLDGYVAVQVGVAAAINRPHAAVAEFAKEFTAADLGRQRRVRRGAEGGMGGVLVGKEGA